VKEARYQLRQSPEESDTEQRSANPQSCRLSLPDGQAAHLDALGLLSILPIAAGIALATGSGYVTLAASVGLREAHPIQSCSTQKCGQCGCGAVVAHHLAKVRVASSNLVIRSSEDSWFTTMVAWPSGQAPACKAVYTGSNPVATSTHPLKLNTLCCFHSTGGWRSGSALP
jgi:hypothetical protein